MTSLSYPEQYILVEESAIRKPLGSEGRSLEAVGHVKVPARSCYFTGGALAFSNFQAQFKILFVIYLYITYMV